MTTVSALQPSGLSTTSLLAQAQKSVATTTALAAYANPASGGIPALSFPPPANGSTSAVPPGRIDNPGRQTAVLAFGPSVGVSALTRTYTPTGQLVPPGPSAVDLFAQPVRGINYLA